MKKIILLTIGLLTFLSNFAATIVVSNTNDSGAGSLRQAIISANEGDTIRFASNLLIPGGNTIVLSSRIDFYKGLTIKGLFNSTDTLYISGNNTNSHFYVNLASSVNKNLIIDSLALVNSNASLAALFVSDGDSLIIRNSLITNNISTSVSAIQTEMLNLTIDNSIITNNSGSNNTISHSNGLSSNISNSRISNNSGTISLFSDYVSIDNSFIEYNSGGTIAALNINANDSLIINNSSINNNQGNGINAFVPYLFINNSSINFNTGNAGVFQGNGDSLVILNSFVSNNTNSGVQAFSEHARIHNSVINNNNNGAVLAGNSSVSSLIIKNSTISNNTASNSSGGISSYGTILMNNCILDNNSSMSGYGGALRVYDSPSLVIKNTTFSNNTCNNAGGAIFAQSDNISVDSTTFSNNQSSTGKGGGIYSNVFNSSNNTIIINNSIVDGNTAQNSGGGIYAQSCSSFTINNCNVINNSSSDRAGGLFVTSNSATTLNINNSTIDNNSSIGNGGGLFANSSYTNLIATNSTFSNNSSDANGGAFHAEEYAFGSGTLSISLINSTLNNNSAQQGAGISAGAYSMNGTANVSMTNSTLSNNTATINGGGVHVYSESDLTLNLTNSTIVDNIATLGNGLYTQSNNVSTINLKGSIIHNGTNNVYNNGSSSITSLGYNIFNNSPIGINTTDKTNITVSQLNLGSLQNNGGATQTMIPLCGSIALNAGDPIDLSDAQNISICQNRRDVGAAESCNWVNSNITVAGDLLTSMETGATYQWVSCPSYSFISGATGPSYTATENGNYAVIITKNGCTDTSDCRYAGPHLGLDLAGSGNKVKTNYILNPTNGFTVEYDMYMHNIQNYNAGLTSTCGNKPSPLDFYINSAGVASLVTGNCSTFTSSNQAGGFVANQWYHIAIAHDKPSNKTYLYVDGIKRDSVTRALTMDTTGLILGDRKDSVTNAEAKFDNVRIWSLTRTPQEILNNKSACLSGNETGLDVLYLMEEGSGNVINDLALGNGAQNGAIKGVVKWGSGTKSFNTSNISPTACLSYPSPSGKTFTTSGMYLDTITSAYGCDSIISINLTVNQPTSGTEIKSACSSYTWPLNGMTYTSSTNSPTFNITGGNAKGCDSLVTLNLTINQPTTGTEIQTACNSYTWPLNGMTYTSSTNSPTFNITGGNAKGCDSLVTLNLTINQSTSGTDTQMACNSYTWPLNGMTYTASTNSPTFNIVGGNSNGCDSLVTLNLTIGTFVTGIDTQTACNSYTWPLNSMTYNASTSTPTHTIVGGSVDGCDSVVTLNLTINTVNATASLSGTTLSASNTNGTYQWLDCDNSNLPIIGATNQTYTATWNSNYAVTVTENGCSETSNCISVQSTSISNLSFDRVSIHPNPVSSLLFIEIGTVTQAYDMTITSLDGKQMMQQFNLSDNQLNIDLSNYSTGVYFINLENGIDSKVFKIIKD